MSVGPPISGLITEAVLYKFEAIVYHIFSPNLWKWYVDDTFVIKDKNRHSDFHMALNNALPGIQFTLDKEKGIYLSFLDILIHRLLTCTLETSIYKRSTLSDVVLPF